MLFSYPQHHMIHDVVKMYANKADGIGVTTFPKIWLCSSSTSDSLAVAFLIDRIAICL